jgi:hypothetical protein
MYGHACIFLINFLRIWFLGILYRAIIWKYWCGQVYCTYLLKSILSNFSLHLYEFSTNFYEFFNFEQISGNYLIKLKKEKGFTHVWPPLGPYPMPLWARAPFSTAGRVGHGLGTWPTQLAQSAWLAVPAAQGAPARCGHHAGDRRDGAANDGFVAAPCGRGRWRTALRHKVKPLGNTAGDRTHRAAPRRWGGRRARHSDAFRRWITSSGRLW